MDTLGLTEHGARPGLYACHGLGNNQVRLCLLFKQQRYRASLQHIRCVSAKCLKASVTILDVSECNYPAVNETRMSWFKFSAKIKLISGIYLECVACLNEYVFLSYEVMREIIGGVVYTCY